MITSKALIITILLSWCLGEHTLTINDCASFKVTHTVSERNGIYSLDLLIVGGKAPINVILSKQTGELVTENFSLRHFDSLPSGEYYCVIVDSQNCKRKLEIKVP